MIPAILLTLSLAAGGQGLISSVVQETSSPTKTAANPAPKRITWYTDWGQALEEAGRTGRPLFLMSAAPRCHDVPGLW